MESRRELRVWTSKNHVAVGKKWPKAVGKANVVPRASQELGNGKGEYIAGGLRISAISATDCCFKRARNAALSSKALVLYGASGIQRLRLGLS